MPWDFGAAIVGGGGTKHAGTHRTEAEPQHVPAIEVRHPVFLALFLQLRFPILAALSASYHQMSGNPEMPYLGNGSGRLKRSQRA